ncbi:MAG: pyrroline-5-carboxylate reductase [Alphaproteobacteria bacterium]
MTATGAAVLLVGCGKMGGALMKGWRARNLGLSVTAVEPDAALRRAIESEFGAHAVASPDEIAKSLSPSAVVLAVKPQTMEQVAPAYRPYAASGAVVVSIAAGRTIASLARLLGPKAAIVRAMPNTPASIGEGMTVACAGAGVSAPAKALCERLLSAVGDFAWVEDEALIDAVTAVSGSGPAYVFLLAECLARAGEKAGLPADLSARLARATVAGSGAMLARSETPPGELRRNVTSPGGTTAAALEVLMAEGGLEALMERAVAAALKRSRELAG